MVVKSIVAAVNAQYLEDLEEVYVGYKNKNIKTIVEQLQTWYVITTKENISFKAHFLDPWSDTPEAHIKTFVHQLYRRQVKCEDYGVTVAEANKVNHFVSQMYACNLFKAKKVDDWEEIDDKLWGATQTHFAKQYVKESRKLERDKSHKNLKSSAAFR